MTESQESTLHVGITEAGGDAGATVLVVQGSLDLDTAPRLREMLDGLLASGAIRIVMNLGELTFCDSVGLSAFADVHRACRRRGGYVRLAAPSPFLTRILAVVGLIGQLAIYDTVDAALADDPPGGRPPPPRPEPIR